MKKELQMVKQGEMKCIFCESDKGRLLYDGSSDLYHINCLSNQYKAGNSKAKDIAFALGNKPLGYSWAEIEKVVVRAKRIFYDPSLSVSEAIGLGMISRFDLVNGQSYLGFSKFGEIGIWDSKEICFHLFDKISYKAGYFYRGRFDTQFIPMLECK